MIRVLWTLSTWRKKEKHGDPGIDFQAQVQRSLYRKAGNSAKITEV
jgi:hypothetical protein